MSNIIDQYTVQYYRNSYKHFLIPINVENLVSNSGILPPIFKKQRGRPKTKRIRKGGGKEKEAILCSNCQETGHNRRTCRLAPAHSRRQRAQDREPIADSDLDVESKIESDEELAELDRAAQVAWEIVERNQSLFEGLDSESDSELSMPANSQVMEGIEGSSEVIGDGGIAGIEGGSEVTGIDGDSDHKVRHEGQGSYI